MTGAEKIRRALVRSGLCNKDQASATDIRKGYQVSTREYGWHVTPFGRTAIYYGATIGYALDRVVMLAELQGLEPPVTYLKERGG